MKLYTCAFLVLASTLTAHNHGASAVEIEAIAVTDRIYMITGQGGNIGLAIDDQYTLMIDDQFAPLSEAIQAKILSLSDKPIAYLLNTHFHGDHTGGNQNFSNHVGVIVAHENVRKTLANGTTVQAFGMEMEPYPESALPALTYSESMTIHQAGEAIEILHFTNAHTDGDSAVYFKDSNVLHTGDLYFSGFYPFIDTSNGGDIHGFIRAQKALLERIDDDTKIIPGHGPLSSKADLERDVAMLASFVAEVESALAKGLDALSIKELPAIQAADATHGGGFLNTEKFLDIVIVGLR